MPVLIIDLDLTSADGSKRYKKAGKMPKRGTKAFQKWVERWNKGMLEDTPVYPVLRLIEDLRDSYHCFPVTIEAAESFNPVGRMNNGNLGNACLFNHFQVSS